MGDDDAIDQNKNTKDEINEDEPLTDESGSSPGAPQDGESGDGVEQVDIVLSSDDGSQPDTKRPNRGFSKRVNKLNRRNEASQQEANQASEALEVEKQKNRLLELALQQKSESATAPDPLQFDDGVSDPRYIQANNEYLLGQVGETVKKHIPKQEPAPPQHDYALERKQGIHYENAEKLGVADYETVEDKAIEILGKDIVNQLISSNDESHKILYFLGKNPGKAEDISDLIKTNPIRGVMELGALGEGLKVVRNKANMNHAPDPDDELEGTSPANLTSDEKRLDKLRAEAAETGKMDRLIAFKRQMKEKAHA